MPSTSLFMGWGLPTRRSLAARRSGSQLPKVRTGTGPVKVGADVVEKANLRAYAWSDAALYGISQKIVTDLRGYARCNGARIARFTPRTGRLWMTEAQNGPETGEFEFTGHSPDGEVKQRFDVLPGAFDVSESDVRAGSRR